MQPWRTLLLAVVFCGAKAESLKLPVVVFDHAGVPPQVLAQAEAHYAAVLSRAGIDIQWVHPDPGSDSVQVEASALVIYVNRGERAAARGLLGVAVRRSGGRRTDAAIILYDNIEAVSNGNPFTRPLILGQVMAHETGHLLLGAGHSLRGIMAECFDRTDLLDIEQGLAVFTAKEALGMRTRIAARASALPLPPNPNPR